MGNTLIIKEDNSNKSIPDDNADGGMIIKFGQRFKPMTIGNRDGSFWHHFTSPRYTS